MSSTRKITCPRCSCSMDAGVVVARPPGAKFKPRKGALGDIGGIKLTSGVFNYRADALRCPACGAVVILPLGTGR